MGGGWLETEVGRPVGFMVGVDEVVTGGRLEYGRNVDVVEYIYAGEIEDVDESGVGSVESVAVPFQTN